MKTPLLLLFLTSVIGCKQTTHCSAVDLSNNIKTVLSGMENVHLLEVMPLTVTFGFKITYTDPNWIQWMVDEEDCAKTSTCMTSRKYKARLQKSLETIYEKAIKCSYNPQGKQVYKGKDMMYAFEICFANKKIVYYGVTRFTKGAVETTLI